MGEQLSVPTVTLNEGDLITVRHYSGCHQQQAVVTDIAEKSVFIKFGLAGEHELWIRDTPARRSGRFRARVMRCWSVDMGAVGQLRAGWAAKVKATKEALADAK
jgi:hypothetical protein